MQQQIEAALNKVRPTLRADGGDIELIDYKDGILQVAFTGDCAQCPMAELTLNQGVSVVLKREVPEIEEVVLVHKHKAMGC